MVNAGRHFMNTPGDPVDAVDRYTIGHGMLGFLLGLWGMPWWLSGGIAVLWEITENPLKKAYPGLFPDGRPDTLANATADIAVWMAGHAIARALWKDQPVSPIWTGK